MSNTSVPQKKNVSDFIYNHNITILRHLKYMMLVLGKEEIIKSAQPLYLNYLTLLGAAVSLCVDDVCVQLIRTSWFFYFLLQLTLLYGNSLNCGCMDRNKDGSGGLYSKLANRKHWFVYQFTSVIQIPLRRTNDWQSAPLKWLDEQNSFKTQTTVVRPVRWSLSHNASRAASNV